MRSGLGPLVRKELTELRRDRRVLLLTLVLPVLLYPAVIGAMDRLRAERQTEVREQVMRVVITGGARELVDAIGAIDGMILASATRDTALAWARSGRMVLAVELPPALSPAATDTVRLHGRFTREATLEAARRVETALARSLAGQRQQRFEARGGSGDFDAVFARTDLNVATASAQSGAEASRLLVYLLLMTVFMASATLATDMVAGEKERGTLETLFLAPLERSAIARAKLIVVSLGTVTTGVMSLTSLAVSYALGWIGNDGARLQLDTATLLLVASLLVPLGILMGAVLLSVSSWARSLKEAQYFVLPVMLVVFVPALLSMNQSIELDPLVALLPIANVAFVMRDVLAHQFSVSMVGLVLISTIVWIVLASRLVTHLLSREETVLGFDPEPFFARTPGGRRRAADVGMALTVLGYFYGGQWLQARDLQWGLAASLWVWLPLLAVGVAWLVRPTGVAWRERLSLRAPTWSAACGGVLLGWGMMLPMAAGVQRLQSYVLPMAKEQAEGFGDLFGGFGMGWLFLMAAVSPAICEELVFRGLFLGILREQRRTRTAILLSALWFALIHLSIYRILPTFLLGVVLALLVTRSRSLVPAMLLHLTYNGTLLLGARWVEDHPLPLPPDGLVAWGLSLLVLAVGAWLAGFSPGLRPRRRPLE